MFIAHEIYILVNLVYRYLFKAHNYVQTARSRWLIFQHLTQCLETVCLSQFQSDSINSTGTVALEWILRLCLHVCTASSIYCKTQNLMFSKEK